MIDEWNGNRTGYAQFSDDMRMRYRLARFAHPATARLWHERRSLVAVSGHKTATFVMLNPSTADAFKPDPTVSRCIEFARRWGCEIVQVVNLFALRSPYPEDLHRAARAAEPTGADMANDDAIVAACMGAERVIAAWGNHGMLNSRAESVAELLSHRGVMLEALRILDSGIPSHPLARGRNFIPYDTEPVRFSP